MFKLRDKIGVCNLIPTGSQITIIDVFGQFLTRL